MGLQHYAFVTMVMCYFCTLCIPAISTAAAAHRWWNGGIGKPGRRHTLVPSHLELFSHHTSHNCCEWHPAGYESRAWEATKLSPALVKSIPSPIRLTVWSQSYDSRSTKQSVNCDQRDIPLTVLRTEVLFVQSILLKASRRGMGLVLCVLSSVWCYVHSTFN